MYVCMYVCIFMCIYIDTYRQTYIGPTTWTPNPEHHVSPASVRGGYWLEAFGSIWLKPCPRHKVAIEERHCVQRQFYTCFDHAVSYVYRQEDRYVWYMTVLLCVCIGVCLRVCVGVRLNCVW